MTWQLFDGSPQQWDEIVVRLGATTPFQLSSWSQFRESFGWRSFRLSDGGNNQAIQMLVKSIGAVRVAWAPGSPLGEVSAADLAELALNVRRILGGAVVYIRLGDHRPKDPGRLERLREAGWSACSSSIGGAETLIRTLDQETGSIHDLYSSNWSRNLRRGMQRGVTANVWDAPEPDQVALLHREVEELKGSFGAEWRGDSAAVKRLLDSFGNKIVMVKAEDAEGAMLAIRAAVVIGTNGFDFLAATSSAGRKNYASNVALDALLSALAARGVSRYDFGGVDRVLNKGVFDFKHGAGGIDHTYNGEFETAVPRLVKSLVSKLVSFRLSA